MSPAARARPVTGASGCCGTASQPDPDLPGPAGRAAPCCGSAADAQRAASCCDPAAKQEAVASGRGCCG